MKRARSVAALVHTAPPLRVLLLRRPEARAAGWQFVTGRVEETDADLAAAAIREIEEETALPPPDELAPLGLETQFTGYDGVAYTHTFFAARYAKEDAPRVSTEHEEARWVTADEAARLLRWDDDRAALARLAAAVREDGSYR